MKVADSVLFAMAELVACLWAQCMSW